jgi:glycosidase
MAVETPKGLRNQVMYSVFVRQFSAEGTFEKVTEALPRIRALGADVLWLLPIHPIGAEKRKGALGSPYAIRDYRAVNPEFGTLRDFHTLVDAAHALGMKVIIDVVYNHTSPDSVLAAEHPDWFYHRPDGSFGNRIGEWGDVVDLDYGRPALWAYQIETLTYWARIVDGFRCDVAPLIPLAFWLEARAAVEKVRPGCLWLSETVEPAFTVDNRARGMVSLSDSEIYQAFDLSYEYDIYEDFMRCVRGDGTLRAYTEAINRQEPIYPDNYVKLRFLENHDRPRAAELFPDGRRLRNWTAFLYFQKGMTLLYNGQETGNTFRPSLFDRDPVRWDTGVNIAPLLARLGEIKRRAVFTDSAYHVRDTGNGILVATHRSRAGRALGVFSTLGAAAPAPVEWPDGEAVNRIDGRTLRVENGRLSSDGEPVILIADGEEYHG